MTSSVLLVLLTGTSCVWSVETVSATDSDYYPSYDDYGGYEYSDPSPPPPLSIALLHASFTVQCGEEGGRILLHNRKEVDLGENVVRVSDTVYTVRRVGVQDWGVWECGGLQRSLAVLPTTNLPYIVEGEGRILTNSSVIRVREGQMLNLACGLIKASGGSLGPSWPPKWIWEAEPAVDPGPSVDQGGQGTHLVSQLGPLTVSRSMQGSSLACRLEGVTMTRITLEVEHPPEFTIARERGFGTPVYVGTSLALVCTIEASPASKALWERDGKIVSNR